MPICKIRPVIPKAISRFERGRVYRAEGVPSHPMAAATVPRPQPYSHTLAGPGRGSSRSKAALRARFLSYL